MTAAECLASVLAYSLQLAALVVGVAVAVRVLRLADPTVQLAAWQGTFAAACVLSIVGVAVWWFRIEVPETGVSWHMSALAVSMQDAGVPMLRWSEAAVLVLLGGAVVRLSMLAVGLVRVREWRRRAIPYRAHAPRGRGLQILVSDAIAAPVTVGVANPAVLVPEGFAGLPGPVQVAVLCHEAFHVRRRDPLRIFVAEAWCACLWFHPAARALVSRMELAREMTLDRETIATTRDRRAYAQALLTFATADHGPSAAAFTRRSHVFQRIEAIRHEVPAMTTSRRLCAFLVVAALSGCTTAVAAAVAPMPGRSPVVGSSDPQEPVRPGNGVQLPRVVREVKPEYTPEALEAKIQGGVIMSVVVEPDGSVGRVAVVQSLDRTYGLDDQALKAMKQWSFEPGRKDGETVPVEVKVEMTFTLKP